MAVQKAKLKIENGETIECLFNPKDYTVTKTNNWKAEAKQGSTAAKPSYTGGNPWEMTLQLLFDSTLLKPKMTVKQVTQTLFDAMDATCGEGAGTGGKKNTKRPPTVTFEYGWFSFVAVVKNLSVQYTLFQPDGEPIRADVKLALMQYETERPKGQNPTTQGEGGLGAHVVRDGDSLQSIAHHAYGDPTRWRAIAVANGIDNPLRLRSGATLSVPRLDA
jgi:nucleoid-associated protein YgaU